MLELTVTDSGAMTGTASVQLDPETVVLTLASQPVGLQLTIGSRTDTAPFTHTVIVGSANSISAASPQSLSGTNYEWSTWSDSGAQTHNIVAGSTPVTYTATYTEITGNSPPTAVAAGLPLSGVVPLTVDFDGSGSSDPDGDSLSYAWDLDGDGQFDDSTLVDPSFTYTSDGTVVVGLQVDDGNGGTDIYTVTSSVSTGGGGDGHVSLPGSSGNYISAPDDSRLDVSGDLDVRADVSLDDWQTSNAKLLTKSGGISISPLVGLGWRGGTVETFSVFVIRLSVCRLLMVIVSRCGECLMLMTAVVAIRSPSTIGPTPVLF